MGVGENILGYMFEKVVGRPAILWIVLANLGPKILANPVTCGILAKVVHSEWFVALVRMMGSCRLVVLPLTAVEAL